MQVVLPIVTALLAGGAGLWFGRLGKALDRRRERLDVEAAAEAERAFLLAGKRAAKLPRFALTQRVKGYTLENYSRHPATGISVTFTDYPREKVKGLPDEPFALGSQERVDFRLPGTKDLIEMPQMWVMCAEYANPVPVRVAFVESELP
jgi:type II secretory pathway pseudopilin PulG